ncbi:MAG: TonB-dependent receptor [Bryobacteraceae bacterium]|nr:TonB-dependent receptor [Bryobacteraceae bacterium]
MITKEEIRKYGYRTLGEALQNVRGVYITDDYAYQYIGLRGFSLPGDYSTRILVMLNGHYMTDNVYSSNGYLGQDFPLDLDLVERIEVVRGPSSALYGSNGVFATINIVTKSPVDHPLGRANLELGSYGEKKLQLSTASYLGRGVNLLLSTSAFHAAGRSVYFPELADSVANGGLAEGIGGEQGQHVFVQTLWRDWTFTALAGDRRVLAPQGAWGTVFNDSGNWNRDRRGYVEASYSRPIGSASQIQWRVHYDSYRYSGRFDIDYYGDGTVWENRDRVSGDWAGSRLSYSLPLRRSATLTLGGEINADVRKALWNGDVAPIHTEYADVDAPDRTVGAFAQAQWKLTPRWTGYFGGRLDRSKNYGGFFSPRVALIYQQSPRTTWKLLGGRAFRNPNAYEAFYKTVLLNVDNPFLKPESMATVEAAVEKKLGARLTAAASVYQYWLRNLIQGVPVAEDLFQFQNGAAVGARGAEAELSGRPHERLEIAGSYAFQKVDDSMFGPATVNSPRSVAKFRFATPLIQNRLDLAGAFRYLSSRRTLSGGELPPAPLFDLIYSTRQLHRSFDMRFGIHNLLNRSYHDPVGSENVTDRLLQKGRTFFIALMWRYEE